jgi:predicted DNA-binding protein with PD1-like motif
MPEPRSNLETLALRLPPDVDLRQTLKSIVHQENITAGDHSQMIEILPDLQYQQVLDEHTGFAELTIGPITANSKPSQIQT